MLTNLHTVGYEDDQYTFELTDDEFGTIQDSILAFEDTEPAYPDSAYKEDVMAVIKVYSNRNLDVASNLVMLFAIFEGEPVYTYKIIEDLPEYQPYREQVEKLLLLR